jgi:tRNA-specific adenosine deaminase 2
MNATNRTRNGTRHAEFLALDEIMRARDEDDGKKPRYAPEMLRECDLYVTVEPCIMCASLLRQVGIRKVFFGAANEKFGGTGGVLSIHVGNGRKAGDGVEGVEVEGGEEWERWHRDDYEVSGGWLREEAIVLLRRFYVQENDRGEFLSFVYNSLLPGPAGLKVTGYG